MTNYVKIFYDPSCNKAIPCKSIFNLFLLNFIGIETNKVLDILNICLVLDQIKQDVEQ